MVRRRRPRKDVGRLASQVAASCAASSKPTYTPHIDSGDFVIVINAKDVRLTGRKDEQKIYGTPLSRRVEDAHGGRDAADQAGEDGRARRLGHAAPQSAGSSPDPQTEGRYAGREHPHEAQKPEPIAVEG